MDLLPTELKDHILSYCDDNSLGLTLPCVAKLYTNITEDNGALWKSKCFNKYRDDLDVAPKPPNKSWKQFYFSDQIKLFPLYGFTIGHATFEELSKAPNATVGTAAGSTNFVCINGVNFWCSKFRNNTFYRMYLVQGLYVIPKEWQDFGIVWNKSWNEYKRFFKKWNKNYKVETAPHYKDFLDRRCFSASITSIAKEESDVTYQIQLDFGYTEGNEDSKDTLYSITIMSYRDDGEYERRFNEQRIDE